MVFRLCGFANQSWQIRIVFALLYIFLRFFFAFTPLFSFLCALTF